MRQEVLSSSFPHIVEQRVRWEIGGKMHSSQEYRAIVDRNSGKVFSIVSSGYRVIRHEKAIEEIESVISEVPELGEYRVTTDSYNEGGRMRRVYVFFEHEVSVTPGGLVKNPVLPHGASSKEKALLAIHPRSSERGILAFSRKPHHYPPQQL